MLAARMREIRMVREWKQNYVAKEMEISQQAYSFFEKASNSPKIDTLMRFCEVMKIDISFLFAFEVPVTKENIDKYGSNGFAYLIIEHNKLTHKLEFLKNLNKIHAQGEKLRYIPLASGQ